MIFGEPLVGRRVGHRGARHEHRDAPPRRAERVDEEMRAAHVRRERGRGAVPGASHVRFACAVVHGRRRPSADGGRDLLAMQQVDRLPRHTVAWRRHRRAGAVPRRDLGAVTGEQLEQVAAGKTGGPRDEDAHTWPPEVRRKKLELRTKKLELKSVTLKNVRPGRSNPDRAFFWF